MKPALPPSLTATAPTLIAALTLVTVLGSGCAVPGARSDPPPFTIHFDYRFDSAAYFTPRHRALLDQAAAVFESRITDTLEPIAASPGDDYRLLFCNPELPINCDIAIPETLKAVHNEPIPANTLVVFVASYDYGSPHRLGEAGYGVQIADKVSPGLARKLRCRGQSGGCPADDEAATDTGPWGGSMSISSSVDWYLDDEIKTDDVPPERYDFYSMVLHELGHLLGFGVADSWKARLIHEGVPYFMGGDGVGKQELFADTGHWTDAKPSTREGLGDYEAAMDRNQVPGQRKLFTDLDFAALRDIGWQVQAPPPPPWWKRWLD